MDDDLFLHRLTMAQEAAIETIRSTKTTSGALPSNRDPSSYLLAATMAVISLLLDTIESEAILDLVEETLASSAPQDEVSTELSRALLYELRDRIADFR